MIHLLFIISLLLSTITIITPNKRKKPLIIGFIFLFIIAALRDEYGNDFESYRLIFENAHLDVNSANIEMGFFELNKLFPSYRLLLVVLSLVYLWVAYKMIVNNVEEKYQFFSMFILLFNPYLLLLSFSSLRQTLALCFFVIALNIKIKNQLAEVLLCCILIFASSQIHETAWLLIPMYFYFNLKRTKKIEHIERVFFIVAPIVLIAASGFLTSLIDYVLGYFDNNLTYLSYIENNTPNSLRSTLLTTIFYVYVLMNLNKVEGKTYQYSRMYLCGLLFGILAFRYSMFGRFQMYFDLFGIISLPMLVCECRKRAQKNTIDELVNVYIFPVLIIVVFVLRYYSFFNTPVWESFLEYKTFLF